MMAVFFQLLIAAGILYSDFPPVWVFMVLLFAVVIPFVLKDVREEIRAPGRRNLLESSPEIEEVGADADRLVSIFGTVFSTLFPSFAFGIVGWKVFIWVSKTFFGGSIFGFEPSDDWTILVGAIVAAIYGAWTLLVYLLLSRVYRSRTM